MTCCVCPQSRNGSRQTSFRSVRAYNPSSLEVSGLLSLLKLDPTNVVRAHDSWRPDSSTEISSCNEFDIRNLQFGAPTFRNSEYRKRGDYGQDSPPPTS